jgi:hypothetical protein
MTDFGSWIAERASHLYTRAGCRAAGAWPSCVSDAHARELLASEYTDYAIVEAMNELGSVVRSTTPQVWKSWNDVVREYDVRCRQVVSHAVETRLPRSLQMARDKVSSLSASIIIASWLEEYWDVPQTSRVFAPLDAELLSGRVVCGWADGLYPEGTWMVW